MFKKLKKVLKNHFFFLLVELILILEKKMLLESNHINILLSFVRSISKSNDPDQLLSLNKVYENIFSNKLIYFLCIK
jgi:hypothetical protein